MEYSKEFKSRHGFANFETKTFQITNKKNSENVICELLKVPCNEYIRTYKEVLCEGGGWYSNSGNIISEKIKEDSYWLVILNEKCLGFIDSNYKKTLSNKLPILYLGITRIIKHYLK
jgi:hypothetical protein